MNPDGSGKQRARSVMINTLDTKRANGNTWLASLDVATIPYYDAEHELEDISISDGTDAEDTNTEDSTQGSDMTAPDEDNTNTGNNEGSGETTAPDEENTNIGDNEGSGDTTAPDEDNTNTGDNEGGGDTTAPDAEDTQTGENSETVISDTSGISVGLSVSATLGKKKMVVRTVKGAKIVLKSNKKIFKKNGKETKTYTISSAKKRNVIKLGGKLTKGVRIKLTVSYGELENSVLI